MNKVETKKVWAKAGLPTPPYRVVRRGEKIAQSTRLVRCESHRQRQQHRRLSLQSPRRKLRPGRRRHPASSGTPRIRTHRGIHRRHRIDRRPPGRKTAGPDPHRPQSASFSITKPNTDPPKPSTVSKPAFPRKSSKTAATWPAAPTSRRRPRSRPHRHHVEFRQRSLSAGNQHPSRLHPQQPSARSRQTRRHRFGPLVDRLVRRAAGRGTDVCAG